MTSSSHHPLEHLNLLEQLIRSLRCRTISPTCAVFLVSILLICSSSSDFLSQSPARLRGGYWRKPVGYDQLIPVYNTSSEALKHNDSLSNSSYSFREGRRSVVSGGLFSIVSFDNVPCLASTGDIGTCYSTRECTNLAGGNLGICAGNFGVCCVLTVASGGTVTANNTYFESPGFPSTITGPSSSTITVNKLPGATELYLEFDTFQITGPTAGNCLNDTFTVTIGATPPVTVPVLCGNLGGQGYYIPIGSAPGPFKITVNLGNANASAADAWKIRIVQFPPGSSCAAPPGCQLYFQDPSGTVETFNYNGGQGELINNVCTNMCFQLAPGFCNILLTENEFMLEGTAPSDCPDGDFLLADGQKFCGDTLGNGMLLVNQTMGTTGFIQVEVCSGIANPDMDVGFSLNYTQVPCMGTGRR